MLTTNEFEILEKRIQSCKEPGSRILGRIANNIKHTINDRLDDWADHNEWDQYSVWSKD